MKCNSILDRATFQGLEVDLCPKCGGLWLDRGEITRAARLPEKELARLRNLLIGQSGPPPIPAASVAPCPACPGKLAEVLLGAVHVDDCPSSARTRPGRGCFGGVVFRSGHRAA